MTKTARERFVVMAAAVTYPQAPTLYGTFTSIRAAEAWAMAHVPDQTWQVKPLHKIDVTTGEVVS